MDGGKGRAAGPRPGDTADGDAEYFTVHSGDECDGPDHERATGSNEYFDLVDGTAWWGEANKMWKVLLTSLALLEGGRSSC